MVNRFLRCLSTVSIGGTLDEKLDAARRAGFSGVELFARDLLDSGQSPSAVRRIASQLGLALEVYGPLYDVEGVAHETCGGWSRTERLLDIGAEIGARTIVACSNASPTALDDPARSAAQLFALAERAAARGLRIGFEALSWGTHVRTCRAAWNIVRAAAHPRLGLVLDTFHMSARHVDPAFLDTIPGDRIFLVQVADAPPLEGDLVFQSRHHRCLPGEGVVDLAAMLGGLVKTGYRGPMSLEIFSDQLRRACPRDTARRAMRALRALEDQIGERAREHVGR